MYCTLQEAYNIPSFVSKKKKGCMNPLSTQMDNKQSPPIGKISADNYDPYDAYTAENGKEHALAIELAKNAGVYNQSMTANNMTTPQISNKKTIEGFSGENGLTMYNTMTTEIPYKAQTKDYKYYCDAFNICPDPNTSIEGFANSADSAQFQQWQQQLQQSQTIGMNPDRQYRPSDRRHPGPSDRRHSDPSDRGHSDPSEDKPWERRKAQYDSNAVSSQTIETFTSDSSSPSSLYSPTFVPQGYDEQEQSSAPISLPYYGSNPLGKCGPLQAPPYILPVNDSNTAQFQQAMDVAVNQSGSQSSDINGQYPLRRVDMSKVGAYYDEELEKFLTTQSMHSEKLPPPLKETPVDVNKYDSIYPLRSLYQKTENPSIIESMPPSKPPASVNNLFSQPTMPMNVYNNTATTSTSNPNYLQSSQYILDILLFIGGGIIIILLCDQIFRLGMSYGMRDTVKVLMPYLQDIQQSIKLQNI